MDLDYSNLSNEQAELFKKLDDDSEAFATLNLDAYRHLIENKDNNNQTILNVVTSIQFFRSQNADTVEIDGYTYDKEIYSNVFPELVFYISDINNQDNYDQTPLMNTIETATEYLGTENFDTLLSSGANIYMIDANALSPFDQCLGYLEDQHANNRKYPPLIRKQLIRMARKLLKVEEENVLAKQKQFTAVMKDVNKGKRANMVLRKGVRKSIGKLRKEIKERKLSAEDCPVCLENLGTGGCATLGCHHSFHKTCIQTQRKCPTCRVAIDKSKTKACRSYKHYDKTSPKRK